MKKNRRETGVTLRERVLYWFDNHMSKGPLGLIRVLAIASILLAILIAGLIIVFRFHEEGNEVSVVWDSVAGIINAWVPSFEDGSPGYVILMTVVAIAGVLFTSVLIGIVTSSIEEKIIELKRGNSFVLEKGHTVVLGFHPGEYTLLRQLILAADGKPACLVLAENMEREEMEQAIAENLEVPKNFRIICRTADITDPASIEKCSIETCKTVIVSPTEDLRTVKAVLSVSTLMNSKGINDIRVNAIISRDEYRFPPTLAATHNITTLQTNEILAKMMAHACTQTGLSDTFRELFDFEGSEFYLIHLPVAVGITFENLMVRMNHAVPSGIYRDGEIILNPPADFRIEKGDRILIFAENGNAATLEKSGDLEDRQEELPNFLTADDETDTIIIGYNETLPVILSELPENVSAVTIVCQQLSEAEERRLRKKAPKRDLRIDWIHADTESEEDLLEIAQKANHIVILNDHTLDEEEADIRAVLLLLNLRDIRSRYDLQFNITVEMRTEHNQKLVEAREQTDFLVSSSMSSLILAQLAENPELIGAFREILSNQGNELLIKKVGGTSLSGKHTIRELRRMVLKQGYILFGFTREQKRSVFNLPLDEEITLEPGDGIIVLGDK